MLADNCHEYALNRRSLLAGMGVSTGTVLASARGLAGEKAENWNASTIVSAIRQPVIPQGVFPITDYGARDGGATLCTQAFADAIAACAANGGGTVLVPPGKFLTGPIRLRSNMRLHLADEAHVLFSTDTRHFPIVHTRWEGNELMNYSPLIYAYRESNIAITGKGTLDGQGSDAFWWAWKGPWEGTVDNGWRKGSPNQLAARAKLVEMNAKNVPVERRVFGDGAYLRPPLIQTYACDTVLIEDVRLRRSPFWQVHPVLCSHVTVRGLDILGHGPNADGCDPESCNMMLIEKTVFDTGDDCIAVKSGRNDDGRRFAQPTQNLVIRDCQMKEGHAGIAIGSEISGGVHDVYVERCQMSSPDLDYALRFKNNSVRGGILERLYYRDISVGQVKHFAIYCDFNYEEGANGSHKPVLRDVEIERMTVANAACVLDAQGLPSAHIGKFVLRDCQFNGVSQPSIVKYVDELVLDGVAVNGKRVQAL